MDVCLLFILLISPCYSNESIVETAKKLERGKSVYIAMEWIIYILLCIFAILFVHSICTICLTIKGKEPYDIVWFALCQIFCGMTIFFVVIYVEHSWINLEDRKFKTIAIIERIEELEPLKYKIECKCNETSEMSCDVLVKEQRTGICNGGYRCCSRRNITIGKNEMAVCTNETIKSECNLTHYDFTKQTIGLFYFGLDKKKILISKSEVIPIDIECYPEFFEHPYWTKMKYNYEYFDNSEKYENHKEEILNGCINKSVYRSYADVELDNNDIVYSNLMIANLGYFDEREKKAIGVILFATIAPILMFITSSMTIMYKWNIEQHMISDEEQDYGNSADYSSGNENAMV